MNYLKPNMQSDIDDIEEDWPSAGYSWYVVGILLIAFTVSFIDRHILTLMNQPIRADLGLTDTQFSLLVGAAFSLFYTIMGVPIARMADRKSRKIIIIVGISIWCTMTTLCGLARSFWLLFFARMGVGVGEAALSPSAYSIISDYFPPQRLGRAISVYAMGVYLGAGLAMIAGSLIIGLLNEIPEVTLPIVGTFNSWQLTFFAVGIPGLLLIPLMYTVKEPVRRGLAVTKGRKIAEQQVSLPELFAFLRTNIRTFGSIFLGFALIGIASIGYMVWTPEFIRRTYGWSISDAGFIYGVFLIFFGGAGVFCGGALADYLVRRGHKDAALRASVYCVCLKVPCVILAPLMPSVFLGISMLGLAVFTLALTQGLAPTAIQLITPNQMRAQVIAVYFLIANLLAIGLGPSLFALVTDYGFGYDGALRYSLSIVSGVAAFGGLALQYYGLRHYRESLKRAEEWVIK